MAFDEDKNLIDFNDPKYNEYLAEEEGLAHPTTCRNCKRVRDISETGRVYPGYRYCMRCYDKMKEIGQIVPEFRFKTQLDHVLLWEGDPFNENTDDPTNDMFSEGFKV